MAKQVTTTIKRPKGTIIVNLQGRNVECVSISVLARLCGVKTDTLRRYERAGVLPQANLRIPSKGTALMPSKGNRLYTKELAIKVATAFEKSKQGVAMTEEAKQIIKNAFVEERLKYLTKK
jgi:DNA-binding transcriptional MerR regulator